MPTTNTKLQNDRIETVFYLTLFVTIVQAGFILWDLTTMLPGVSTLIGLQTPNKIQSSNLMSNLYLALLGIYAGYKEFLRWTSGSTEQEIPEEQVKRFKRGEFIVTFWVVLAVVAMSIWQMKLIANMPAELFRTAMQALAIMFGTYASKGLYGKTKQKKVADFQVEDDLKQKVLDYIKTNGSVDNDTCQKTFGIDRGKAYRILEKLEKEKLIKSEGTGKAIKYVLIRA